MALVGVSVVSSVSAVVGERDLERQPVREREALEPLAVELGGRAQRRRSRSSTSHASPLGRSPWIGSPCSSIRSSGESRSSATSWPPTA